MRAALLGAAVAAVLLTAAFVRLAGDPEIQSCHGATTAMNAANVAHEDAKRVLEGWFRRGGEPAEVARLQVAKAKAELDATRAAFKLACHYEAGGR